jgi:hypothetical protein
MDHLPMPHNPCRPIFKVPLVCKSGYSLGKGPFYKFPARHLESLRNDGDQTAPSTNEILLSLIQSWLFFGVITEFFQKEVEIHTFTKLSEDGSTIICTSELLPMKNRWFISHAFRSGADRRNTFNKHITILIQALYACEQFEKADIWIQGIEEILTSVRILICSLAIATQAIVEQSSDLEHLLQLLRLRSCGSRGTRLRDFQFFDHMVMNGWW